jgi:hypothetical protein
MYTGIALDFYFLNLHASGEFAINVTWLTKDPWRFKSTNEITTVKGACIAMGKYEMEKEM